MTTPRVVLMVVDGLRADALDTDWLPSVTRFAMGARRFTGHRGVFPSATRISSASLATGCQPARHGLAGNSICWDEGEGLVPVSVGPPTFLERWRAVTGHTLLEPTLAQRVADHGGMCIHSNSSAGAAHMQDPEGHATFFHRSGSWTRGFVPATTTLDVTYDGTGDAITTARCIDVLLNGPVHPLHLLWICEPDHSQHALELGSPEHLAIQAGSDRLVAQMHDTVQRLRGRGEDVLFVLASDHGQETTGDIVDVDAALVAAGLKADADSRDVVVASSGMGALVYLADEVADRAEPIARFLRDQSWCEEAWSGNELALVGQAPTNRLGVAFAMARRDEPNRYGVRGIADVVRDRFSPNDGQGLGQHGGLGPYEGSPVLVIEGRGFEAGVDSRATSLVDVAPTVLSHLGLPADGMDGNQLAV